MKTNAIFTLLCGFFLLLQPGWGAATNDGSDVLFYDDLNYANKAAFEENWHIINPNEDMTKWVYMKGKNNDLNGADDGGCVSSTGIMATPDEYMINAYPIALEAGEITISFWYKTGKDGSSESMDLLFGKSDDYTQLEKIGEIREADGKTYRQYALNYTVSEAGDYYICFNYNTAEGAYFFYLDEICISVAKEPLRPDLAVRKIMLPLSSCAIAQETVSVTVHNEGAADLEHFTLTATDETGQILATQTFETTLTPDHGTTVTFDQKFDFSSTGDYAITVFGGLDEGLDQHTANDTLTAYTSNLLPITAYPYACTDFLNEWEPLTEGWQRNESTGDWLGYLNGATLVSDCFKLQKEHVYRIYLNFVAGGLSMGSIRTDDFCLLCGTAGSPIEDWDTVHQFTEQYKQEAGWEYCSFAAKDDGDFQFAIVVVEKYLPRFYNFKIEEITENKVTFRNLTSSLYAQMPVAQLNSDHHYAAFTLENEGTGDMACTLKVENGDKLLAEQEITIPLGVTETYKVGIPLKQYNFAINDKLNLKFSIHPEWDSEQSDNEQSMSVLATDCTMAIDTKEGNLVNQSNIGGLMSFGMMYEIVETDILSGFSAALYEMNSPYEFAFDIYTVDEAQQKLGQKIYHTVVNRYTQTDWYNYPTPPFKLDPGKYMFIVTQRDYNFLNIQIDKNPAGKFYLFNGMKYTSFSDYGNLCLRPLFAEIKPMVKQDAMVYEFRKPTRTEGIFTENEPVSVNIQNFGSEIIYNLPVICEVDEQTRACFIDTLKPYEYVMVEFRLDLSEVGTHEIKVYTELEGDENPANNALTMTVNCLDIAVDPYVMDFELTENFAIDNFVPGWTSVDVDSVHPYVLLSAGVTFPNDGKPFGFMAFNPAKVNPSVSEIEEFLPAQGHRYGIAFSSVSVPNNDWLISPKLKMADKDAHMTFLIKSLSSATELLEDYRVWVSTTGNQPEDFVRITEDLEAPADWSQIKLDLSAYNGQEIYIAFQCISNNKKALLIDDIRIAKPGSANTKLQSNINASLWPNPASDLLFIDGGGTEMQSVEIYNGIGVPVYRSYRKTAQYRISIDQLKAGVYFAKVRSEYGTKTLKFVVAR